MKCVKCNIERRVNFRLYSNGNILEVFVKFVIMKMINIIKRKDDKIITKLLLKIVIYVKSLNV